MTPPEPIAVYRTEECCWRCHGLLVRLEPACDGWSYYCRQCEMLTSTLTDLRAAPSAWWRA
jgi:hypothetical protein